MKIWSAITSVFGKGSKEQVNRNNSSDEISLQPQVLLFKIDIENSVHKVLSEYIGIDEDVKIPDEACLDQDLGMDSLDKTELLYELDNEFDTSFPDQWNDSVITVKDLYDFVFQELNKPTEMVNGVNYCH